MIERDACYPNLPKQPMMTVHASALTAPISPHESPLVSDRHLWARLAATDLPRMGGIGRVAYWHDWPRHFGIAVGLHFGATPPLPPALRPIHQGSFFTLYRVAGPE